MTNPSVWKNFLAVLLFCAASAIVLPAQIFKTLAEFNGTNGASPETMSLVQGLDGSFYGTTFYGGAGGCYDGYDEGCGTVFKVTRRGSLTALHSFSTSDGAYPAAGLVLATDGNFYGTASEGGSEEPCNNPFGVGCGTVFKATATGNLTTLYSFCVQANCPDGSLPVGGLIQAADRSLYGTTEEGGVGVACNNVLNVGCGTVFRITTAGVLTTLYNFCSEMSCLDGASPNAALVQGTDGNFYGATLFGGIQAFTCSNDINGCGTVYKITVAGKLTTLHTFCSFSANGCEDGTEPNPLIQAKDGNFYGTTDGGGLYGCGTVFRISPSGKLTTLHSFNYQSDGCQPFGRLSQATDGNFYGTTAEGGGGGNSGTVFEITPEGALTTLVLVDQGINPWAGLLQATNGTLYGTTNNGGNPSCRPYGCGTVFSLDIGLEPFVAFVRSSGKVGQTDGILGQGFTGTTSVSLNGTPASFKVLSDTLIRATVPAGATTGYVTVTTPSGTLTSNVPFHVIP